MKCISCGGEMGLTDERCPFCGRVVTETAGHRAELKSYKTKSEITKRGLAQTLAANVPLAISAVVMVVLFIACVVAFYVEDNAYIFRSDSMRRDSVKNYEEYSAEINKYLEAGDYTGFAAFKEYHNIAEWEAPYDDLDLLWEMAEDYSYLVSELEASLMYGPQAEKYHPEEDVYDCRRAIHEFYYDYEENRSEIDSDPYGGYIHDMKDKADIVLKVYMGLDDPAREAYLASSDIEQEAYLEGVILDE